MSLITDEEIEMILGPRNTRGPQSALTRIIDRLRVAERALDNVLAMSNRRDFYTDVREAAYAELREEGLLHG